MLKKNFLVALLATALIFGFIGCDTGTGNPGKKNNGNLDYDIGDTGPAGGTIFYYSATGFTVYRDAEDTVGTLCNYLEAAPNDMPKSLAWGSSADVTVTGTSNKIGMGKRNTAIILAEDEDAPAAKACYEYGDPKDGWYLPSRDELAELYKSGKGGFVSIKDDATWKDCYWSSSQEFDIGAWYTRFSTGDQINEYQNNTYSVRAIRAFSEIPEPASMDDYEDLEPEMANNPNRYRVHVASTVTVTIPSYVSVPSGAAVTFAINTDYTSIAQITDSTATSCTVKGLAIGSARLSISVNGTVKATVIIAVVPRQQFYTLPDGDEIEFPPGTDVEGYKTEPTYQLAWIWRNPNKSLGASGVNCGIDILAYYVDPTGSASNGWVRTTFGFGGWHYDLNGTTNTMTNGEQTVGSVTLKLNPEFVYDNGVPYLQIRHTLTNNGATAVSNQKFGASADVMIEGNDRAPLTHLPYGALMTNATGTSKPTIKLRLVCQGMQGVSDVTTLWMGNFGSERTHIYDDQRTDINTGTLPDTALNFSYQGISLNPGESKNFVVRFTQVQ